MPTEQPGDGQTLSDEALARPPAPSATVPAAPAAFVPPTVYNADAAPPVPPTLATLTDQDARPSVPAAGTTPARPLPTVPGYEVLKELGRGGMGVVYKARDLKLNRTVALKMLLAGGHAGPQDRLRFQIEAETVAGFRHPNIIEIYEVGEHNGIPYLALEYLEGQGLDEYLTGRTVAPDEAARLVETLARAIHCAHLHGIVHRDLKPSNVFVTRDGTLRVLDFGLAKRRESAGHTQSGAVMGTPSYMAPEQASGQTRDVGPEADVYALGAILYEMLAARPPFKADTVLTTLDQVRRQEPVPPSRLRARLPRDLEVICLKCLRKLPQKRYASAEALADDLRRFLNGEPILARPVPAWERLVKWARRRPTLAALVAVSAAALLTLLGVGFWYNARLQMSNAELREARDRTDQANVELRAARDRAERRSQLARTAVDDMYVQVAEKWLDSEPGEDPVQKEFLEKALHVYEELAREEGDNPGLREATARANFRTGQIYYKLGRLDDAEKAYERALPVQEDMVRRTPGSVDYRQELARTYNWLGELLRTMKRPRDALPYYDQALRLQSALASATDNPSYRKEEARTSANRGLARQLVNQPEEALKDFDHAIALLEPAARRFPDDPSYAQELARVLNSRGSLLRVGRRTDAAEDDYREAIRIQTDLKEHFPRKPDYRLELAVSLNNLANLLGARHRWRSGAEALKANAAALELLERLSGDYPGRPRYRREWANALNSRAALLVRNDVDGAAAAWERSAKLYDALTCEAKDVPDYHFGAGLALGNLGWLDLDRRRQPAKARPLLERAAGHLEQAVAANEGNPFYRAVLGFVYDNLAEACWLLGDDASAAEVLRKRAAL